MSHAHDDGDLADLLDLDGETLRGYWTEAVLSVCRAADGTAPKRVLDLGAGTGVGALEFVRRCGVAHVTAVDYSPEMLAHLREKALQLGVADRVHTVHADLDEGLPAVELVDITWASASMHHLADPDRVLREVYAVTRPGGLVAVAEFGERLRFLPDDIGLGRPGFEARCLDVLAARDHDAMPHLDSHWAPRLAAAGFTDVVERDFEIAVGPPLTRQGARYARRWLSRMAHGIADQLAPDDLAALGELLGDGPQSLQHRDDLRIRGSRTLTLARRA